MRDYQVRKAENVSTTEIRETTRSLRDIESLREVYPKQFDCIEHFSGKYHIIFNSAVTPPIPHPTKIPNRPKRGNKKQTRQKGERQCHKKCARTH